MINKPTNSPDFNIIDLGIFRAVQSLQYNTAPNTIDELIDAVYAAYESTAPGELNDIFLMLYKCMEASLFKNGGKHY